MMSTLSPSIKIHGLVFFCGGEPICEKCELLHHRQIFRSTVSAQCRGDGLIPNLFNDGRTENIGDEGVADPHRKRRIWSSPYTTLVQDRLKLIVPTRMQMWLRRR